MKILNFGSLNIDHVYSVENFVKPGETISSLSYNIFSGGKGLNQSIALKRAGVESLYHAGKVGLDGKILLDKLDEEQIDHQFVTSDGKYTGHAIIQVDSSGQNNIILSCGANGQVSQEEICSVLTHFHKGDIIVLQNEISNLDYIMKKSHEIGLEIFLNPSPIDAHLLSCPLELVTMFIMNELEAAALSGDPDSSKAIDILKAKYPNSKFIITLGKNGVKYYDGKQVHFSPAFNIKSIDTTAAGDTFTGYFIASYTENKSPEEILFHASKAAALAITKKGAAESIPSRDQVKEALFELQKI